MNLREGPARLYIDGVALWSQRLPGWERARRILAGLEPAPADAAPKPVATLLPPTERRRAPDTVTIAIASGLEACAAAARDPKSLPAVFASTHGDLAITDYMCATLASDPALLSPTKFHNSVHNAAAGYWSIGTGSMRSYTATSAGAYTFGAGLLEACVQVMSANEAVLLVAYDIDSRGPLAPMAPSRHLLSAAFVIAPARGARTVAALELELTRTDVPASQARADSAALIEGNAMETCLPFLEALAVEGPREVILHASPEMGLRLRLS